MWKEIPYPEVEWGEDQVWAFEMLKLGFEKAIIPKANLPKGRIAAARAGADLDAIAGAGRIVKAHGYLQSARGNIKRGNRRQQSRTPCLGGRQHHA